MNLLGLFFPILKDIIARVIPDPAQRLELQKQMAEAEAQAREAEAKAEEARANEFAAFIAATQPSADRVYVWMNTLIAAVRPAMAVFVLISLVVYTEKWQAILSTLAGAGIWGAIGISPLLVWVLGRDGLRMVFGAIATWKGGVVPPEVLPPGLRAPADSGTPPRLPIAPKPAPRPVVTPPPLPPVPGDNR